MLRLWKPFVSRIDVAERSESDIQEDQTETVTHKREDTQPPTTASDGFADQD